MSLPGWSSVGNLLKVTVKLPCTVRCSPGSLLFFCTLSPALVLSIGCPVPSGWGCQQRLGFEPRLKEPLLLTGVQLNEPTPNLGGRQNSKQQAPSFRSTWTAVLTNPDARHLVPIHSGHGSSPRHPVMTGNSLRSMSMLCREETGAAETPANLGTRAGKQREHSANGNPQTQGAQYRQDAPQSWMPQTIAEQTCDPEEF